MVFTGNEICDICIKIMVWWSKHGPLNYGEINVLLFIIIQPLICLISIGSVFYMYFVRKSMFALLLNVLMLAMYIVGTAVLVILPIMDGILK